MIRERLSSIAVVLLAVLAALKFCFGTATGIRIDDEFDASNGGYLPPQNPPWPPSYKMQDS